jgi:hypothetical protein
MVSVPDYSKPGEEGVLPDGARQWGRGVVYLAKRAIPSPLPPGGEYRIALGFKLRQEPSAGYREVFHRALEIAHARIAQIKGKPHVWTIAQGWMSLPNVPGIAVAFVALGLKSQGPGEDLPEGEPPPDEQAWNAPYSAAGLPPGVYDEFYNAFDFGGEGPTMISYGESMTPCDSIFYEPFVGRAERMAAFYRELRPRQVDGPLQILRRSWYSPSPNLVTVDIHF